jgi:hypothetical protein
VVIEPKSGRRRQRWFGVSLRSLLNSAQQLTCGFQGPANWLRLSVVAGDGQRGLELHDP